MISRLQKTLALNLLCLSMTVLAQNPSHYRPYNPAGIVSVPPSSYQNGLINRTDSAGLTSDMIITGNVGGGKHFRAGLPYSPPHTINTELGSAYLDSFLRHSGSAESLPLSTGMYAPFYSPTGTVTRSVPGQAAVLTPRAPYRRPTLGGPSISPRHQQVFSVPGIQTVLSSDRSLARQLVALETPSFQPGPGQAYWKRFLQQHAPLDAPDAEWPTLASEQGTAMPTDRDATAEQGMPVSPDPAAALPEEAMSTLATLTPTQWEDYFKTQQTSEPSSADPPETHLQAEALVANGGGPWPQADSAQPTTLSTEGQEVTTPAQAALAQYVTLQAFAQAKYHQFMQRGHDHQQGGDYRKAADAYTLADAYQPNDPAASAGKSLALFAQSQFSTSALFLARTLERRPTYAQVAIDLEAHVGGTAALHQRIGEAETFLRRSGSFDLSFLLAYVYYQINDLGMAQEAIDKALRKQPEHVGAKALRQAIEGKKKG